MESPQTTALPLVTDMPQTTRRRSSPRKPLPRRRQMRRETDRFFRQLVAGMRNGVLAITRDGLVAEMNAEAQRIFQLK